MKELLSGQRIVIQRIILAESTETMRNVVTDKAENSISADLPMGAISPHKILAVRANMCPCTFLFILFFLLRLQKNNYFLKLKSLFSFYILVVCWKYMSDVLSLYVGRVVSICRTCCIYMSDVSHLYIQRHRYIDVKGTG